MNAGVEDVQIVIPTGSLEQTSAPYESHHKVRLPMEYRIPVERLVSKSLIMIMVNAY